MLYIDNVEIFVNEIVPEGAMRVSWSKDNVGWGQMDFILEDGKFKVDTECMSKEFVKEVLDTLYKELEVM